MLNWITDNTLLALNPNPEGWPLGFESSLAPGLSILLLGDTKADEETALNLYMEKAPLILDEHELALG